MSQESNMDGASIVAFNEMLQPLQRVHDIDEKHLPQLVREIRRILTEAETRKAELEKGKK